MTIGTRDEPITGMLFVRLYRLAIPIERPRVGSAFSFLCQRNRRGSTRDVPAPEAS